jgi:hypothetical protein
MSLLTKNIYKITKSKTITINLIFAFFLPGIIIHELSHALFAGLLFVPMGRISFYPEITKDGIRLGSLEIAQTDFIRRFFIGISPIIIGLILILFIIYSLVSNIYLFQSVIPPVIFNLILIYFLFTICNTMFSSKKDLEGAGFFLLMIVLLLIFLYFIGIRINYDFLIPFTKYLKSGLLFLLIPSIINLLIYLVIKIIIRIKSASISRN